MSGFVRRTGLPRKKRRRRGTLRLGRLIRRLVGLEPEIVVEGVRYHARTGEPLRRALGPTGRGSKEYDVRFPTGERMRIRATARRVYADIAGSARLGLYQKLAETARPGMRVLDLSSGTGAGAAWLSQRVGPSGAVVALEEDGEAVRFARRRYPWENIAFEILEQRSLEGEPDGAFDGIVLIENPGTLDDRNELLRARTTEIPRLVRPGGWVHLAAAAPSETLREEISMLARRLGAEAPEADEVGPGAGWTLFRPESQA